MPKPGIALNALSAATAAAPGNISGTNGFQYTKMGASLSAINPIAGAVATGVGLGADLLTGASERDKARKRMVQAGQDSFLANHVDPYKLDRGYEQGFRFGDGGPIDDKPEPTRQDSINAVAFQKWYDRYNDQPTGLMDYLKAVKPTDAELKSRKNIGLKENFHGVEVNQKEIYTSPRYPGVGGISFGYNALATTPWDMLTEEQRVERIRQYGYKGTPYANYRMPARQSGTDRQGYADGGIVSVGHVIPADNTRKAMEDAARSGLDIARPVQAVNEPVGGIVPGNGLPTADDRTLVPSGGSPIRVSSGEAYVTDDTMEQMAKANGMDLSTYMMRMYPNSHALLRRTAGFYFGGPAYNAMDDLTRPPTMASVPAMPRYRPVELSPELTPAQYQERSGVPSRMEPRSAIASHRTSPAVVPKSLPVTTDDTGNTGNAASAGDKANNTALAVNLGLGLGSLAYNIFQKRNVPAPPTELVPQLLDLHTGALRNQLATARKRGIASALYAQRGHQDMGRELGVVSLDLDQRQKAALAVEQQANTERRVNNQLLNRTSSYNLARRDAFNQQQAQAQDQFRLMNGQAVSSSINMITGSLASWVNNRTVLKEADKRSDLYDSYGNYVNGVTRPGGFKAGGPVKRFSY
jgi:hypothetical protein